MSPLSPLHTTFSSFQKCLAGAAKSQRALLVIEKYGIDASTLAKVNDVICAITKLNQDKNLTDQLNEQVNNRLKDQRSTGSELKEQNSPSTSIEHCKINKDNTEIKTEDNSQSIQNIVKGSKSIPSESKILNTALTKSKSSRNLNDALKAIDTDNAEAKSNLLKNEKVRAELKEINKLREDKDLNKMSKSKSDRYLDKNKSTSCMNVDKSDRNDRTETRNSENELDVGNSAETHSDKKDRGNLKKSKSDDLIRGSATNLVKLFNEFKLLKKKKRKRWDVPSEAGGSANECVKMKRKHGRSAERDNGEAVNGNGEMRELRDGERDPLIRELRRKLKDDFGEHSDGRHRRSTLVKERLKEIDEIVNESKDDENDSKDQDLNEQKEVENDQNVTNTSKRKPDTESSRRSSKKDVLEEEDLNDDDYGFDSTFRAKMATLPLTKTG